jgi:glycosyltransferase involved in cell wall biosynthesis
MEVMDTQRPLVSVIVATFNRAHIISPALESALQQTLTNYEIIVVDDGSTDNTREFLTRRYGDKIRYIGKTKNEGLASARNTGIEASRGTYIALLDDDDLWLPEKLALQVHRAQKNPALGLVYCGACKVNEAGEVLELIKPTKRGAIFEDMLYRNYLLGPASVALIARDVLLKTGCFDKNLCPCADWDLWIRIARCAEVDFVEEPLVHYVIHDNNMHKDIHGMEKDTFAILDKYWPALVKEKGCSDRKNKTYSDHCIHFARHYYQGGERESFKRLLYRALEYYPLNQVTIHGNDLTEKENALFEVFHDFWSKRTGPEDSANKKKSYTTHYSTLAWEYYHRDDLKRFRRSVARAFYHSFPRIPVRLAIPFLKSFLGRDIADGIHRVRERFLKGRAGV